MSTFQFSMKYIVVVPTHKPLYLPPYLTIGDPSTQTDAPLENPVDLV